MLVARQHDNCSVLGVGNEDSQLTEKLIAALFRVVDFFSSVGHLSVTLLVGVGRGSPTLSLKPTNPFMVLF